MGASLTLLVISGCSSLFLVTLFTIEGYRGVRYGEQVRAVFDRMLISMRTSVKSVAPDINNYFFQELFYYAIHKVLSFFLTVVRKLEHSVLHVVRFNRMQVIRLRKYGALDDMSKNASPDSHLELIAEHKKSVELTPHEKQKRKDASISGSGPF